MDPILYMLLYINKIMALNISGTPWANQYTYVIFMIQQPQVIEYVLSAVR